MEQLQEIYCHYTEALQAAKKAASPLAGIFGTGGGINQHPCHQEFYDQVGKWTERFLADDPDAEAVEEVARFILVAGVAHKNLPTYWFVCAAQAHAKPMLGMLSRECCEQLRQEYDSLYPASNRLPLTQEIYEALCEGAGVKPQKKGFFSFLKK